MPLPTVAELTDPSATNTQMKQRLGQLVENVASKELVDSRVSSLLNPDDDLLVGTTLTTGYISKTGASITRENWQRTDFIKIQTNDIIKFKVSATSSVSLIAAYDAAKNFIGDLSSDFTTTVLTEKSNQIQITNDEVVYVRLSFYALNSYNFKRQHLAIRADLLDLDVISTNTVQALSGSKNLYSKSTVTDNCTLINNILTAGYSNWFTTDFIAVTPKQNYMTNGSSSGSSAGVGIHYYDSSKNFISVGLKQKANEPFVIPAGVSFIRLSFSKPVSPAIGDIYVILGEMYRPNIIVEKVKEVLDEIPQKPSSRYSGKVLMTLGDSITDSTATSFTYPPIVANYLGMTLFDGGWSGRRIRNAFGRTTIASDTNILASHIITIAHGTNDFKLETSLGTIDDSPTPKATLDNATYNATTNQTDGTFYADYKGVIEHILTVNPQARIMLITPIRRTQKAATNTDTNAKGFKLVDYANAVKAIAQYYGLPVLDNYNTSGFNTQTISNWTSDGLHPTEWAQRNIMAQKIIGFIESN